MFHMVLGAVRHPLKMNSDSAMAVHTSNGIACCVGSIGDGDLLPSPLVFPIDHVFAALLAPQHQVVWHTGSLISH
jgi:hypothetical protein